MVVGFRSLAVLSNRRECVWILAEDREARGGLFDRDVVAVCRMRTEQLDHASRPVLVDWRLASSDVLLASLLVEVVDCLRIDLLSFLVRAVDHQTEGLFRPQTAVPRAAARFVRPRFYADYVLNLSV